MSINNETTVVYESIVMDALEHIWVNITMTTCHKNTSLELEFVLLSALLLLMAVTIFSLGLVFFSRSIFASHTSHIAFVFTVASVLIFVLVFFLFVINFVELFKQKTFKIGIFRILDLVLIIV